MVDSFEKIPVKIFDNLKQGSVFIAQEIAGIIRRKQSEGKNCVLGLATGSSPKTVYAELVSMSASYDRPNAHAQTLWKLPEIGEPNGGV